MEVPTMNIEDLEDGEIESDGEEVAQNQNDDKNEENPIEDEDKLTIEKSLEQYYPKQGKKKKSKSKGEKLKDKSGKKNRKYSNPPEDDFAGSIEKAIRKAMNKSEDIDEYEYKNDNNEEKRKHKKRKKNDNKDGTGKKRKKQEYSDEMDETEMMCIRGASPVQKHSSTDMYPDDEKDSYASDSSNESRSREHHRPQRQRPQQRERNKHNKNDWRRGAHPMQDPDGVCLFYMQGKCHKGDDCIYSHDAQPPRKMELCKFYLMDCCAKRDKCLYMHADFPCKYYHTGLPCIYKEECKFAHGKPLTENLKNILLKHIESAPKEILGDFPRLNKEGALKMIHTTQAKLMQLFPDASDTQEKGIPSLFELNIPNPQAANDISQVNQFGNDRQPKVSPKVRQSRWQNDNINQNFNANLSPGGNASTSNVLNIKNLTGVLTPRQISDLTKMGIETLDQLGQLTVLQLNSIGISLKQITEIQMNTMSIQKLGLINTDQHTPVLLTSSAGTKDLDLRVPPAVSVVNNVSLSSDLPGQDVDMRFQPGVTITKNEDSSSNVSVTKESQINKDMIDIDQYTKDALKFATKDKENIDVSNETFETEYKPNPTFEIKDVDHRILPFCDESTKNTQIVSDSIIIKKECDTDIRFLQPEPIFKNPERRNRRSTTDDDEENNLLIDEKWYSSDEEKATKKKTPMSSPQSEQRMSPQQLLPPVIEPSSVLSRLGDLSKIDISAEVTKLLNTMKNNLHDTTMKNNLDDTKIEPVTGSPDPRKSRDPRAKKSPEKADVNKTSTKKSPRISIYECIDGEPTDGRRRSDVDLRKPEFPTFGDTDLRQSASGDIDFRLSLPFKAIPNYTPASEINGSINSHPPIPYKLIPIEIPRPDYTDIRNSTAKSQALLDPRLRKVFRLSLDESNSDSEKSTKPVSTGPRMDPRRKQTDATENSGLEQKQSSLDIQTILQNSDWFKELSSTQKISVNQHLMPVMQMIKQHQQDKVPGKIFDLTSIQNNSILCSIFTNLGVSLGDNGEFSYLPKPTEALLQTSLPYQQGNPFGINTSMMDANSMNVMNMPPMGVPNVGGMGHMHGFNQHMTDPRGGPPTPGLLGIAPNIPHNFNNFAPNNFNNMAFNGPNGPGNEGNYVDGDQNFQRYPNRGGHRGRGNDRWNRGNFGRGPRDRKNFNDRGNWKNDRH